MQRWQLLVSGKVQGVFYRKETKKKALALNVTGYVRNLKDGRVEIIAEGEKNNLQQLLDWCWEGPEKAQVTDVELVPQHANGEFATFSVNE